MSATNTNSDPVAKAIASAKEPITEYIISLPESRQEFPIPPEDAQTADAIRDAVAPLYAEAAQADITCAQVGSRLVITLKSKPAGKGCSHD
jgi:hypothetical protein